MLLGCSDDVILGGMDPTLVDSRLPIGSAFALDGRVALITGASSGIGAGIAAALAQAGASVSLVGRDRARLEAVASEIDPAARRAHTVIADLAEATAPAAVVAAAVSHYGRLDVIVHSAGLFYPKAFADTTLAEFQEQWTVNVQAPFLLTQAALPHLGAGSSVIFISSMLGECGSAQCAAYCATKGAVELMSKALAVELGNVGIRFNTIAPGAIETPMNAGFREDPEYYETFRTFAPASRWGQVRDIAPAAVFLAASASDFVHGATLAIDGGWLAR
jgi:NAD(P)-dependent dehydrogenase (short-subunit alcohol dehydrogenase family)